MLHFGPIKIQLPFSHFSQSPCCLQGLGETARGTPSFHNGFLLSFLIKALWNGQLIVFSVHRFSCLSFSATSGPGCFSDLCSPCSAVSSAYSHFQVMDWMLFHKVFTAWDIVVQHNPALNSSTTLFLSCCVPWIH